MNNLKSNVKQKIILIYLTSAILSILSYYFVIPLLFDYAPGTVNTQFDKDVSDGLYFWQKIAISGVFLCLILAIYLIIALSDINKYKIYKQEYLKNNSSNAKIKLDRIKKTCFNLTNNVLIFFTIGPLISSFITLVNSSKNSSLSDLRLTIVTFALCYIFIFIANVYVKKILSKVLIDLENTSIGNAKKSSIVNSLLFQSIILIFICIFFSYIVVTSTYEDNISNKLYSHYSDKLNLIADNKDYKNVDDLKESLNSISLFSKDNVLFIADSDFDFIYQTGELSDFFKKYARDLSIMNDYKIYNSYNSSCEGVLVPVTINNVQYYIGVYYQININNLPINTFITYLLFLVIPAAFLLYQFFSELGHNIKRISNALSGIAKSTNLNEHKLYVTTSDELGDLSVAYNKVQSQYSNYLNQIKSEQDSIVASERLASLGQLIGGIANNLKNPIISISDTTNNFIDLVQEYDLSIENSKVTNDDHHNIAKDMSKCIDKIKDNTGYMSDVITTVKNQAVVLSESDNISFDLDELVKRIDILMKNELKYNYISLNIIMNIDKRTNIRGDINNLVQVIDNMILNSIQAYNGKHNQNIDLIFNKDDKNLVISVKDYACGLPKKVQDKLFKEFVFTKNTNGSGLGLYMSYSTIKAHFNGNITYSTKENVGTTFNITIPLE